MEGIRDGQAIDHCFYCRLLYPEIEDCPECGNRLHYQPARMEDPDACEQRFVTLLKQFQADASPHKARALLVFLHQYPEEMEAWLAGIAPPSLDDLRRAMEAAD